MPLSAADRKWVSGKLDEIFAFAAKLPMTTDRERCMAHCKEQLTNCMLELRSLR